MSKGGKSDRKEGRKKEGREGERMERRRKGREEGREVFPFLRGEACLLTAGGLTLVSFNFTLNRNETKKPR